MKRTCQQAFTFAEVAVSFTLISLLAVLMYPMLVDNVGETKLLNVTKDAAAQIQMAYNDYATSPGISSSTTGANIAGRIKNYLRTISDGSDSTQVVTGGGTVTTPCNASTPCLVLQTGALLQYDANSPFGTSLDPANNAVAFIMDPDGKGPQLAVPFALYIRGRLSTHLQGAPVYGVNNDLPLGTVDPEYLNALKIE